MGESRIEKIIRSTTAGVPYTDPAGSDIEEALLELKEAIEQGGGGTTDYTDLENKPKINNVELSGNKAWSDLGLANPMHIAGRVDTVSELPQTASVGDVYLVGLTAAEKDEYVYTTTGWEYIGASMIPVDSELSPTSENPVQNKVINSVLNGKQDTISDLETIRSNATAGAEAAEVVTGIDSTANNYIELKSGRREYLSTTVPTGAIPTGSVGMGFDEGVYTYMSGTKVSEGVEIADSSDPHYQDKKFPFYANGQNLTDYTIYGNTGGVGDRTANLFNINDYSVGEASFIPKTITLEPNTTYTMSSNCPRYNNGALIVIGNVGESFTTANNGVYPNHPISRTADANGELLIGVRTNGGNYSPADYDTMLNEGNTPLPFEPYGYKIPVICGGQTTNIYLDSPLGANDSIDYATAQVTIPTVDGANTLICDTTVQPSKVSLTYTGWHSDLDDINSRLAAIEQAIANV